MTFLFNEIKCPLLSTSVNISNQSFAKTFNDIPEEINERIHFCFDKAHPLHNKPSTVVDIRSENALILRQGGTKIED